MALSTQPAIDFALIPKPQRIPVLNDNFRATLLDGRVMLTSGVAELPLDSKARLLLAVQSFTAFDEGNDPHHEHDFGALEVDGEKFFFKIDYYDRDIRFGADDPADPEHTTRIMTIMLANEY